MASRESICVFCRKTCASTRDHVPPKGLWPKPRPQLITVPACRLCNEGAHKDDEFMQRLACTVGTENNESAFQVSQNVLRSIRKPEAEGLRKGFGKSVTPVSLITPSGLYAGMGLKLHLDGDRLRRILTKITIGLLWQNKKEQMKLARVVPFSEALVPRLPPNYSVIVHRIGGSPPISSMRHNEQRILKFPDHSIGKGIFAYKYLISAEDSFLSVWRFTIYNCWSFMGYTLLPAENDCSIFVEIGDPASSIRT